MKDRLLFNEDGKTLDEVCFTGAIHLEQEDDASFYLACYESDAPNARFAMFNVYAEPYIAEDDEGETVVRVRLIVSERDADHTLFPLVQRHRTEDEMTKRANDFDWYVTLKDERGAA